MSILRLTYNYKSNIRDMQAGIQRGITAVLFRFGKVMYNEARGMTRGNPARVRPEGQAWRRGRGYLRNAIRFDVDRLKDNVWLGFARYARTTEIHEFGGRKQIKRWNSSRGRMVSFKRRPVMQLSLDKSIAKYQMRWPDVWARHFEGRV